MINDRPKQVKALKVALINSAPIRTGRGNYAYYLLRELRKLGVTVDMFLTRKMELESYNNVYALKRRDLGPPIISKLCKYLFLPAQVPQQYHTYHILSEGISYFTRNCSPSIVTCHDVPSLLDNISVPLRWVRKRAFSCLYNALRIIAVTHYVKQELMSFGLPFRKISVIHLGVDHERFKSLDKVVARKKLGLPVNRRIVLGSDDDRTKNVHVLLKALSLMGNIDRPLLLILGRPNQHLINLVKQFNLMNNVLWYHEIPTKQMPFLYNAADILAYPSIYDTFALVLIEAMACGLPVLTTNYCSMPEVVGDSALIINNPFDHELLKDTIEDLLWNEELLNELRERALQRSRAFSWRKTAVETLSTYMNTLAIEGT